MTTNKTQAAMDRFEDAIEHEKLRATFAEDLENEPFCRFEDWAQNLTEVADFVSDAKDAIEQWRDAEDRQEKADAKETALEALDLLLTSWNQSPLDLSVLADWTPPAD